VDKRCTICDLGDEESILHRFWICQSAYQAWQFVIKLLWHIGDVHYERVGPTWEHAIFSANPLESLQGVMRFWSLLRGVALWTLWIAWNDQVFNHISWPRTKIELVIWQGLIDYGRGDWAKTVALITKDPSASIKTLARFDKAWGCYKSICQQEGMRVK
jgi:hypothetical protein